MMIANAITDHTAQTSTAGARATTDSSVRARISQCASTRAPTMAVTQSRLKVGRIGEAAGFWPAMPRSTTHALVKVLARKNTQVTFTSV